MNKEQIWAIHDEIPAEQMPAWKSRRIKAYGEGMMLVENVFKTGDIAPEHAHPHTQITYVIEGAMEFTVENETKVLRKGDSVFIAPDAVHRAIAVEDSLIIDLFAPMREDFVE